MIEPAAKLEADASVRHLVATVGPLCLPIPNDCSDNFAVGWAFADTQVAKGVDPQSVFDENWHHEKAAGFEARLLADQKAGSDTEIGCPVERPITQHEIAHE